jgi:hypothetical protein
MSSSSSFGRFTLAGPPRSVPLAVRLRLLYGGFANQFGWLFFGFGMIFVWVFGFNTDPTALLDFRGDLEEVQGAITRCEDTNASQNDSEIYAHYYLFEADGQEYDGVSYSVGRRSSPGDKVTVQFPPDRPARSRIKGMRTALFPIFVLFVVLFPLIGLCFMLAGFRKGRKAVRLLANGEQALGVLKSKEPTGTRINNRRVYKLTFEFMDQMGQTYEATAKTHEPECLQDDAEEPLLYDPIRPTYATMLDHLPGAPRVDDMGQIQTQSPVKSVLVIIVPALSIIGHGLYLAWRLGSA